MKKVLCILISTIILFSFSVLTFASDVSEIAHLTDTIVKTANSFYGDKLEREITAKDVDLENAFKFYYGVELFEIDTLDTNVIEELLENAKHMYKVPIHVNESTVILLGIMKGEPPRDDVKLADEDYQRILNNVGKWQISTVGWHEANYLDYYDYVTDNLGYIPEKIIYVGSLPYFREGGALVSNKDGVIESFVPFYEATQGADVSKFETSKGVYDYQKTRDYINTLPEETKFQPTQTTVYNTNQTDVASKEQNDNLQTSKLISNTQLIFIIAIFIFAISTVIILVRKNKARK